MPTATPSTVERAMPRALTSSVLSRPASSARAKVSVLL
jgi:hypothetical protein